MPSPGSYILSVALLAVLSLSLGFSAVNLRRRLMPAWAGAPARLVEAIVGVGLLVAISEVLGVLQLLYAGVLVAVSALLAVAVAVGPRVLSGRRGAASQPRVLSGGGDDAEGRLPGGDNAEGRLPGGGVAKWLPQLVALGVVALVFAHWGLTTADALGRGIFNFDSLWYHQPFAVDMAQTHSVTGLHYTETVFTNWFYPQNSELLHGVGILLTDRDTLSLFLNFGWLGIAFLAAWCIGRPYGKAPLTVIAAGVILECHTLVVREPGAAKNDLMAAALLLAAIAVLINAYRPRVAGRGGAGAQRRPLPPPPAGGAQVANLPIGWPIAVAGLAVGLAVGTKSTALAMAAALTLAVIVLAPAGRRWAAAGWWFAAGLAGGGYWYLRNLVISGNPLPQLESLGPISFPHPERLQSGRPDFSIVHYATDTAVWRDYFGPGLNNAFGAFWPIVLAAAIAGALAALIWGRPRVLRWMGGVALFGMLAYIFTPLSAAGAEGMPEGFGINIRYAVPALLAGITLFPIALLRPRADASSLPGVASRGGEPPAGDGGRGCRGTAASSFSPQPESRTAEDAPGEKPSDAPVPPPPDRTRGHEAPVPHLPDRTPGGEPPAAAPPPDRTRGQTPWSLADWALIAALVLALVVTNRADAVVRDPDRIAAWAIALLFVLIPAALLFIGRRPFAVGSAYRNKQRTVLVAAGFVALGLVVAAIGYPVQRSYLDDRYANTDPDTSIPGMHLDSAYRWARDVQGARIGLAGSTAGFLQYGFYGADLSNRVRYIGTEGPHGAFNAIPTCAGFRAAVNDAELDYLVTAPFLNFIEPGDPVASPEARWLRGDSAATPIDRSGPATVWRIDGRLNPSTCRDEDRVVPQQPE